MLSEIRIEEIAQLFHSLDPFPFREKDLDKDAEEFIVGWARELPTDKSLRIVVHLPKTQASTPEAHELEAAVTRYFAYRARSIELDLSELFRIGRRAGYWPCGTFVLRHRRPNSDSHLSAKSHWQCHLRELARFRMGRQLRDQSKYFFTTGGPSFDGAICANDFQRHMWS